MEQKFVVFLASAVLLLVAVAHLAAPVEATDCSAITFNTYGWSTDEVADVMRKSKKENCKNCCKSIGKRYWHLTHAQERVCECSNSAFKSFYSKYV